MPEYKVELDYYRYGVRYLGNEPGRYFALFTNYLDLSVFLSAAGDADLITADYIARDGTAWNAEQTEKR